MAVKRVASNVDIVTAARQRIKNVFSNGVPVYMSFSGGKDSLCLADLTLKLIQAGEIDPAQLTVLFIDEEAIFDCIEETTKAWRKMFLLAGGKSVQEIGKQLGMRPEEVFRLSDFSRDDFLSMMTKGVHGYSKAELLTKY